MAVFFSYANGSAPAGAGSGNYLAMSPSAYTPSSSPAPASFLVSIDGGAWVSTPVVTDTSGNPNLLYSLAAYVGTGSHEAYVIAVDSSGELSTTTGPYGFSV